MNKLKHSPSTVMYIALLKISMVDPKQFLSDHHAMLQCRRLANDALIEINTRRPAIALRALGVKR